MKVEYLPERWRSTLAIYVDLQYWYQMKAKCVVSLSRKSLLSQMLAPEAAKSTKMMGVSSGFLRHRGAEMIFEFTKKRILLCRN